MKVSLWAVGGILSLALTNARGVTWQKPDITVAADGSGDFKTVQTAVASLPKNNRERKLILIKDGVYHEKVRVDASFVTLRGQTRAGTRLEFAQLEDDFQKTNDSLGVAVVNLNGNDLVLENLTAQNTAGVIGPHEFTVFAKGDRTVLLNCDLLSAGADTVAMWPVKSNRCYYSGCKFRGASDFVCPRGWCYATDCSFYSVKATAAVWHDGSKNKDMKFVMRNCNFDGAEGWYLGRHHLDAQFYFLDCKFSKSMTDRAPLRVTYPDDPKRTAALDKSNIWGERSYFYQSHREGGDYEWHKDNISSAPDCPGPDKINAAWTFGEKWNPEKTAGPAIERIDSNRGTIALVFDEVVTVKGKPRLVLENGTFADYASGSGLHTIQFHGAADAPAAVKSIDLNGGAILATGASATLRMAELALPAKK
jgi:pectinesterase